MSAVIQRKDDVLELLPAPLVGIPRGRWGLGSEVPDAWLHGSTLLQLPEQYHQHSVRLQEARGIITDVLHLFY